MKLIVTGATGFVGSEVVRQALRNPAVSFVIAIARRVVQPPPNEDASKFQSFALDDWTGPYPKYLMDGIKGADACIWSLAVTPTKSRSMDFADVTTICHDYTVNGMQIMAAVANKPFRFVYVSGVLIERDQSKVLPHMGEYRLMRGRTENFLVDFAHKNAPDVQVTVTKPGAIDAPSIRETSDAMVKALFNMFGHTPRVHVSELAAAMIDQCQNGITNDPLWSSKLAEIGKKVLKAEDYV
ncbi:hypothetical protein BGW36DRAFT_376574 [Talaromyces proteolyticus]|uniref:NAD-dependent epimerase/dehydratase domain-containing protein n=1 Tax=Talaromyces proteolyticus TaxID=1131652 RepID=A0AAD4KT15_9EURO|nr:uncharacterized protein BGW36DRAFT_376574 [Talaromyces proteolyticus]KAH8698672.1 hypothetical protein BGW36DRAFT_376574 [Talaromyces proteolyticus]